RWLPLRDATLATALLLAAVYGGSSRLAHLDVALLGYLAATVAACFVTVHRVSAFWRRPPSAFYARALLEAVRRPRELRRLLGAAYFLLARLRSRGGPHESAGFHLAPLFLLLAVAASGLALPAAGRSGLPGVFRAAALVHEVSVVALLLALPFTKLAHLLIRPLHLGAQLVRAPGTPRAGCIGCGAPLAPVAQRDAV